MGTCRERESSGGQKGGGREEGGARRERRRRIEIDTELYLHRAYARPTWCSVARRDAAYLAHRITHTYVRTYVRTYARYNVDAISLPKYIRQRYPVNASHHSVFKLISQLFFAPICENGIGIHVPRIHPRYLFDNARKLHRSSSTVERSRLVACTLRATCISSMSTHRSDCNSYLLAYLSIFSGLKS